MQYGRFEVMRPFRWSGKNLKRGDVITARNADQEHRCQIMAQSGLVAPLMEDSVLQSLQALGADLPRNVKAISEID